MESMVADPRRRTKVTALEVLKDQGYELLKMGKRKSPSVLTKEEEYIPKLLSL